MAEREHHEAELLYVTDVCLCTCQGKGVVRQSPLAGPALSPVL